MILAGTMHFIKPEVYTKFFTSNFPQLAIVYISGFVEIILGICALTTRFRKYGTLGILLLMFAFLPLHILDFFKETPAVGSHLIANIRLPFQFVFIAWAWFINKN